jgi:homoserine kinase
MTRAKSITASAPATIANIGPGFDCLGMAICGLSDRVTASLVSGNGVRIHSISGLCEGIPSDVRQNTAGLAVRTLLRAGGTRAGIALDIVKGIPPGSGLGSSAASAVAAVVAVDRLLCLGLAPEGLISFAMQGERASAGTPHADNVAPALLGGVTIVRSTSPMDVATVRPSAKLRAVVMLPNYRLDTRRSRAVLPAGLSLNLATRQWSNVAGLVAGFCLKDDALIARSLEDLVAEPARKKLVPNFACIKRCAIRNGALGCTISGSGPTIFALAKNAIIAERIAAAIKKELLGRHPEYDIFIAAIDRRGAYIAKRRS